MNRFKQIYQSVTAIETDFYVGLTALDFPY